MRFGLAARLSLMVFVALLLGMGVTTYYVISSEKALFLKKAYSRTEGVNNRLFQSLVTVMELGMADPDAIHKAVEKMKETEELQAKEVLDIKLIHAPLIVVRVGKEKKTIQLRPTEGERPADEPERKALRGETVRVETRPGRDGARERTIKYVVPVRAEKRCLDCHAASEGDVLAAFSTTLSLESVYDTLRKRTIDLILLWGIGFVVILGALLLILYSVVLRPVREISRAAHLIATEGDLSRRVKVAAGDEIGELAGAFNSMVESLQKVTVSRDSLDDVMKQFRALSRRLLTMQEEERARLSRELHDQLGKQLAALSLETEWLSRQRAPEPAQVKRLGVMIENTTIETRRICKGLRPTVLDDMGLEPALHFLVREFEDLGVFEIEASISHVELDELDPETSICFYRVLQEALTNVVKHAGAKKVTVSFRKEGGEAVLTVRDDGKGFPSGPLNGGLGLVGMRERGALCGGAVEIESVPDRGTEVTMRAPLAMRDISRAG